MEKTIDQKFKDCMGEKRIFLDVGVPFVFDPSKKINDQITISLDTQIERYNVSGKGERISKEEMTYASFKDYIL